MSSPLNFLMPKQATPTTQPTVQPSVASQMIGTPEMATPKATPTPTYDQHVAAIQQQYPRLSKLPLKVIQEEGKPFYSETYMPWDEDNPHPGNLTIGIRKAKDWTPDRLRSLITSETFHYLGAVNPKTKQPVDPEWYAAKQNFIKAMTPGQQKANQKAYEMDKAAGEKRSFEDFMQHSRTEQFIGAGVFPDLAPNWKKFLAPEQESQFAAFKALLSKTPQPTSAPTK